MPNIHEYTRQVVWGVEDALKKFPNGFTFGPQARDYIANVIVKQELVKDLLLKLGGEWCWVTWHNPHAEALPDGVGLLMPRHMGAHDEHGRLTWRFTSNLGMEHLIAISIIQSIDKEDA